MVFICVLDYSDLIKERNISAFPPQWIKYGGLNQIVVHLVFWCLLKIFQIQAEPPPPLKKKQLH